MRRLRFVCALNSDEFIPLYALDVARVSSFCMCVYIHSQKYFLQYIESAPGWETLVQLQGLAQLSSEIRPAAATIWMRTQ